MPTLAYSEQIMSHKHREIGETFRGACNRVANTLADNPSHYHAFRGTLISGKFSPGGRNWAALGAARMVTAYNCFVLPSVPDSMAGIMQIATEAASTLRLGGGVGYNFSKIRPRGDRIASLESRASGPVSFMEIFHAVCSTIAGAGHRRGAQMGVLRIDHPDILEFVRAKTNDTRLTTFNLSVGVTHAFMRAVEADKPFDLTFEGKTYMTIRARDLWDEIMRSTWDYAEPGVLFLDTINRWNNLSYCETIEATNPCGEQPLPAYGACLLGSINLAQYVHRGSDGWVFDKPQFVNDIPHIVRAMDNVVDRTIYPLPQQEAEAKAKRRMGLGVMGVANAIEATGHLYATEGFLASMEDILATMRDECYRASAMLAAEKGAFAAYEAAYTEAPFVKTLAPDVQELIKKHGIRNSHLLSIAPTGTISLVADNASSGIEPVFAYQQERDVLMPDGSKQTLSLPDLGIEHFQVRGKTADQCTIDDHLSVLLTAQKYVDSAVSKTCNVGPDVSWDDFKQVYIKAWRGGAKGITTYRADGKRGAVLRIKKPKSPEVTELVASEACEACAA